MTPLRNSITDSVADAEESTPLFPKPGSSANEIFAWWGRRLIERSRKFAAQVEEQAHRESLARLKQSLQVLPLNEDEDGDGPALAACLYILIPCPQCSEVRQGLADYPERTEVACPVCGFECAFIALGVG
jgi:hypothetical protein